MMTRAAIAPSGTSAGRQRGLKKKSMRRPGFACWRMMPSATNDLRSSSHTLGLGSCISASSGAPCAIRRRSSTRLEHFAQPCVCVFWSALQAPPSTTSGSSSSNCSQFNITPTLISRRPVVRVQFRSQMLRSGIPLFGLSGSLVLEDVSQLHSGLVQLRLAVADRTTHHVRNLVVLKAFYIVQNKNRSIARRQILHRPIQLDAVNRAGQSQIFCSHIALRRVLLRSEEH